MSEQINLQPEIPPANPELFARTAKALMMIGLRHGKPAPTLEYTLEDKKNDDLYYINAPQFSYSVQPCTPEYMEKLGVRNDSRYVSGFLGCDVESGIRSTTVLLLGEGPSLQYGDLGKVSIYNGDSSEVDVYTITNDGRIALDKAEPVAHGPWVYRWEPTRIATDEEVSLLAEGLESFKVDTPERISDATEEQ